MEVAHLNQKQLAARWSISEATLERWRSAGIGPKFLKQGAVAEEINRNIVNIAQVADQTTEETKRTESAGEELARLTTALQSMVARYVV